jgi:murein DD-endopeptidase MepM/ murein hydrolase activator NlpD
MVEDSTGNCVKKPCKGDPVANVEIAPQLGASGIQGALHDTCARFNEKYKCKGVRGRKWHNGVDLKNPYGAPVFASYDGIARKDKQLNDNGKLDGAGYYVGVISRVNGKTIRLVYFHLQKDKRASGTVKAGDIIGYQGLSGNLGNAIEQNSTTSHVRIKTSVNGIKADPLDYLATTIDPNTRKITNPYN